MTVVLKIVLDENIPFEPSCAEDIRWVSSARPPATVPCGG